MAITFDKIGKLNAEKYILSAGSADDLSNIVQIDKFNTLSADLSAEISAKADFIDDNYSLYEYIGDGTWHELPRELTISDSGILNVIAVIRTSDGESLNSYITSKGSANNYYWVNLSPINTNTDIAGLVRFCCTNANNIVTAPYTSSSSAEWGMTMPMQDDVYSIAYMASWDSSHFTGSYCAQVASNKTSLYTNGYTGKTISCPSGQKYIKIDSGITAKIYIERSGTYTGVAGGTHIVPYAQEFVNVLGDIETLLEDINSGDVA